MFVVNYSNQMRAAFEAGRAAGMAPFMKVELWPGGGTYTDVPSTYEEWIETQRRPQVAIG
jgi:predicted methyltransferase